MKIELEIVSIQKNGDGYQVFLQSHGHTAMLTVDKDQVKKFAVGTLVTVEIKL